MPLSVAEKYSSIRIPRYALTTFSPSDLGEDSERARLSRPSPWTPVFSIFNQSLLTGITVSRYVIKLCITIHNVFSWWARVKKEKIGLRYL